MKGKEKVLEMLSEALANELTAINQYILHAEMMENWGYTRLAAIEKKHSIDEMKHAERIIERILFLEGHPNMSHYLKINIGKTIPEMFAHDLEAELMAVELYNRAAAICEAERDIGSRDLFIDLLKDEEEHVDWLEMQNDQIDHMGIENYLAEQIRG